MRASTTIGCCLVGMTVLSAQSAPRFALRGGCTLPYEVAPTRDVFEFCDNAGRREGAAPPPLADRLRLDAQNNLCARAGTPLELALRDFGSFPKPPSSQLTASRLSLAAVVKDRGPAVGEGTVVRTTGVITKARVAGCSGPEAGKPAGELVSCNMLLGIRHSEIQLNLNTGRADETNTCGDVVAKIITHFRPRAWQDIDVRTPLPPVRITGQLFYDDTASGCSQPGRWEIHPVYAIDVCTSVDSACESGNPARWMPYHRWTEEPAARTQPSGLAERVACRDVSVKWMTETMKRQDD